MIGCSSSPVTRRSSGLMPPVGSSSSSSFGRQRQRHGDFEPLLLAVAELARQIVGAVGQPESIERLHHLAVERRGACASTAAPWQILADCSASSTLS